MKIKRVVFSAGASAFYFDDQKAIKGGAGHDGFVYTGVPVTSGFRRIREPGQSVSVLLELENGAVASGDCAAVQYSGAGGRDPLFLAEVFIPFLEKHVKPKLEGREVDSFRGLAAEFEALTVDGKRLHTAIRYGLSQALLDARAVATNRERNAGSPNCLWQPPRSEAARTRPGWRRIICTAQLDPPECPHSTQGAVSSAGWPARVANSRSAANNARSEPLSGSFQSAHSPFTV